jgi:hypothetical protein
MRICLLAVFLASMGFATSVWHEGDDGQGDAGGMPGSANITIGNGSLTDIIGNLTDNTLGADMYEIFISSPTTFSATVTGNGKDPIVNSALYLFDVNGVGEFGDDDISPSNSLSAIPVGTTNSLAAGLYFILVVPSGHLPAHNNKLLFGDLTGTDTVTPAVNSLVINNYLVTGNTISPADAGKGYDIELTGAEFAQVPEPAGFLLMGAGLGLFGAWKRLRAS